MKPTYRWHARRCVPFSAPGTLVRMCFAACENLRAGLSAVHAGVELSGSMNCEFGGHTNIPVCLWRREGIVHAIYIVCLLLYGSLWVGKTSPPTTYKFTRTICSLTMGGINLYWAAVLKPSHATEKNRIPLLSTPAICPNVEQPIKMMFAVAMQERSFRTSNPTCRNSSLPSTANIPDRRGLQLGAPASFSGHSAGVSASMHLETCE